MLICLEVNNVKGKKKSSKKLNKRKKNIKIQLKKWQKMNNQQNWNSKLFIDKNADFNFRCLNNKEKLTHF